MEETRADGGASFSRFSIGHPLVGAGGGGAGVDETTTQVRALFFVFRVLLGLGLEREGKRG